MRGPQRAVAVLVSLLVLCFAAPAASAYIVVDSTGRIGAYTVADSEAAASVACTYQADDLSALAVSAPQMLSQALRARRVGWQFEVWRAKWWMKTPDQWHLLYTSPIAKGRATRTTSPVFAARQWNVPADLRSAYESFKVRLVLRWYGSDGSTVVGQAKVDLEYSSVDSVASLERCPGSFTAPQPPPDGMTVAGPPGLATMTHWRPYWKKFTQAAVEAMIAEMARMNQTGVVLTGVETGNSYALPPDVSRYLGMMRDAGIQPYLAVWISRFSDAELATTRRAWDAGSGQWAGIVIDVERGLEVFTIENRAAAVAALNDYMADVRTFTTFVAFSSFPNPSDWPSMPWSEMNHHADVLMPQQYFRGDEQALWLLDKMRESIDFESRTWSEPPKSIVPVVNDWGDGVDLAQLEAYIEIAFARYGAVSGWRLHSNMHEEVKDLWGTFPR